MIFPGDGQPQIHHYKFPSKAWFEYHCWESEQSSDAKLWHHTHQKVEVLRLLDPNESDYEMYEVKFSDGLLAHVFADELMNNQSKFTRKDYVKFS